MKINLAIDQMHITVCNKEINMFIQKLYEIQSEHPEIFFTWFINDDHKFY